MTKIELRGADVVHDLMGAAVPGETYRLDALVAEATTGTPTPEVVSVTSQLLDGERRRKVRDGNRTAEFRVKVTAPTGNARSRGGSALALWAARRGVLRFTPVTDDAVDTDFDVVRADVVPESKQENERKGFRVFRVTMECLPFGRPTTPVTVAATPLDVTSDAQLSAADSTSDWSGSAHPSGTGGTGISADTTVKYQGTASIKPVGAGSTVGVDQGATVKFTNKFRITWNSPNGVANNRRYLSIKMYTKYLDATPDLQFYVGGAFHRILRVTPLDSSWSLVTFVLNGGNLVGTLGNVQITGIATATFPKDPSTGAAAVPSDYGIRFDDLRWSGTPPNVVSNEFLQLLSVQGDRRTPGGLAIAHPSSGLGTLLAYSNSAVALGQYEPVLMPYFSSGGTKSSQSGSMSGSRVAFTAAQALAGGVFDMPLRGLPRGGYQFLPYATYNLTSGGTSPTPFRMSVTVAVVLGTTVLGSQTYTKRGSFPSASQYGSTAWAGFLPGIPLDLLPVDMPPGSPAMLRVTWQLTDAAGTTGLAHSLHELFPLAMSDETSLIVVEAGNWRRLWIDAPTLDRPTPSIWLGNAADRSDALHAGRLAARWDVPTLNPTEALQLVANTGGASPAVVATYFPNYNDFAVAPVA